MRSKRKKVILKFSIFFFNQTYWKKDDQIIDYRVAQRAFQNNMDNSLTISGTISLDTGKYTCVATNGLDEDEASAQLVVQGNKIFFNIS